MSEYLIREWGYAEAYPNRVAVSEADGRWEVWLGKELLDEFPTHAEAITYAHEQATRQTLAARFTIPPENPVARAIKEAQ